MCVFSRTQSGCTMRYDMLLALYSPIISCAFDVQFGVELSNNTPLAAAAMDCNALTRAIDCCGPT